MTENKAVELLEYIRETGNGEAPYVGNIAIEIAIKALEEIQQYRAIGTVEEFKALKEKNEPKKPLRIPDDDTCIYYGYYCPCCNEPLSNTARMERCFCGQALDWS